MKLLLVEDNESLRTMIAAHLGAHGFLVDPVETGAQALAAARDTAYSAMILDLGLPDMDGLQVLRLVRGEARRDLPTLILTARDQVQDRVAGLDAGADDYILKPFDVLELEARLRAVLRRPGLRQRPVHMFHDLTFDADSRNAACREASIDLTPREATLLEELIRAGSRIVVRDTLVEHLYGDDGDISGNALEAAVSRLRRKLTACGSHVRIETLRGIGYRLAV